MRRIIVCARSEKLFANARVNNCQSRRWGTLYLPDTGLNFGVDIGREQNAQPTRFAQAGAGLAGQKHAKHPANACVFYLHLNPRPPIEFVRATLHHPSRAERSRINREHTRAAAIHARARRRGDSG